MVHYKLDWFTCIVHDSCIEDVARVLHVDISDFLKRAENESLSCDMIRDEARGHLKMKVFDLNGVHFKIYAQAFDLQVRHNNFTKAIDFFSLRGDVTVEISGSGLDYLRSTVCDNYDDLLMNEDLFGYVEDNFGDYIYNSHITRCDIAFDYVNCYEADFRDMFRVLNELKLAGATYIPSCNSTAASHFSTRFGSDEETIYLGNRNSPRLLRIYNKLLERMVKDKKSDHTSLYFYESEKIKDPCFELKSWFRVEYQLRRDAAAGALYGCAGDLQRVGREICTRYKLGYPKLKGFDHLRPIPCFENVFNFEGLTRIGLNNHSKTKITTSINDKIDSFYNKFFNSIFLLHVKQGTNLIAEMNIELKRLYNSPDLLDKRRYRSLKCKIAQYLMNNNLLDLADTGTLYLDKDSCIQISDMHNMQDLELDYILLSNQKRSLSEENEFLKKYVEWFQLVWDYYCQRCGGFSWNKNLIESVELATKELDFDGRRHFIQ